MSGGWSVAWCDDEEWEAGGGYHRSILTKEKEKEKEGARPACLLACLELEAAVEEEVLRLDVAVVDAALVAEGQRRGQLREDGLGDLCYVGVCVVGGLVGVDEWVCPS